MLDQIKEALDWIEEREGVRPDLSRIDPEDPNVYDLINEGRAKGVFLLQSPAQLQIARRLRARSLQDLAYQVALIRPGVGVQGGAVSQFSARHRDGAAWTTDHPLEAPRPRAHLRRHRLAGAGGAADHGRGRHERRRGGHAAAAPSPGCRAPSSSPGSGSASCRGRARGACPRTQPKRSSPRITGHYLFPESHSHAFAITAYQAVWLKRSYPCEFFVALVNQQPMGFNPLETLKEDARRFGVPLHNPCLNRSRARAIPADGSVRLGLQSVKAVGRAAASVPTGKARIALALLL